jgi:hypothetical protein
MPVVGYFKKDGTASGLVKRCAFSRSLGCVGSKRTASRSRRADAQISPNSQRAFVSVINVRGDHFAGMPLD